MSKWVSIVQNGPCFTHILEPYQPLGCKLMYDGKMYKLKPEEEKVAMLYAKRIVSEKHGSVVERLTKDEVFNKNFWKDFKSYLTDKHKRVFKHFDKIGWKDLKKKARNLKKLTKKEKKDKLRRKEEKKRQYGWVKLDDNMEQVGNFTVEPIGIFMGRGKNPLRGKIKKEINPEDVTINIGIDDPVPAPPAGHKWGKIIHDTSVGWLAKWKDSITGDDKYIQFADTGKFKGQSDLDKYEKARKLQRHISILRKSYMTDAASTNNVKMQLGTVLWLIDNHGIRPGDEKNEDQADTVGASTLRVGHVKILSEQKIKFEFLGKDSIKFEKSMKVPNIIYENFRKLVSGKTKNIQVFDSISACSINTYLKQFDVKFSNKVFRTRLASYIMFEALKDVSIPKNSTKKKTKILFNKANVKVADILNHTRNISVSTEEALKKLHDQLKELKSTINAAKKQGKSKKYIASIKKKIIAKKDSIEAKEDTKSVAINTSLTNYIDPRIVVAWAKREAAKGKKSEVKKLTKKILSDVYNTSMLKKFKWAINSPYITQYWNWLTSPLQGYSELQPDKSTDTNIKPKTKPKPKINIQNITDYKLLLKACKSGFRDIKSLRNLHRVKEKGRYVYPALEWLHPFTLYSVKNNKGNVKLSRKLNKLYKKIIDK
jgi:DNA topoisomerase-1